MENKEIDKLRHRINLLLNVLAIPVLLIIAVFLVGYPAQKKLELLSDRMMQSYLIADRLRHSSDDLTRMVRTYVITGDTLYRDQYYKVLNIREGLIPRPLKYDRIYWDLIIDPTSADPSPGTETISLRELMLSTGFIEKEFELLDRAERNSNDLVKIEKRAMNALVGRFKNDRGLYTIKGEPDQQLAIDLVHNKDYHRAKKEILEPLNEFYASIEERTTTAVKKQELIAHGMAGLLFLCVIVAVIIIYILFQTARSFHIALVKDLNRQVYIKTTEINHSREQLQIANNNLRRSNQEIEQFTNVTSHDLLKPLTNVHKNIEFLKHQIEKGRELAIRKHLDQIVGDVEHMSRLLKDLQLFAKTTTLTGKYEYIELDKILEELEKDRKLGITKNRAKIVYGKLPAIYADRFQMTQLFYNLISNAIKFRSQSDPEITIEYKELEKHWQFAVKDNGIGLDMKHAKKIFLLFQRLHPAEKYAGSGIGLAICKKIVQLYGGRIWAESQPGKGTTIYFTIAKSEEEEAGK